MNSLHDLDSSIDRWFREDIGEGDHTTFSTIAEDTSGSAKLLVKEAGILAGLAVAKRIFQRFDPEIQLHSLMEDGSAIRPGDLVFRVQGKVHTLLQCERLVLNVMQRMSGIATNTNAYVKLLQGTGTKILDTRKTSPGLRFLEKEAVRLGGGVNHRFGLYDMIMIKDNHIDASGGIEKAVEKAVAKNKKGLMIVIEVRNLEEVKEAVICPVDRIMLDNMPLDEMRKAVDIVGGRVALEASGNMTLEKIREAAETGVDFISVGALTNRFKALDIGLDIVQKEQG